MLGLFSSKHESRKSTDSSATQNIPAAASPPASSNNQTEERKLEAKILSLYRRVWLGIYQANDEHGETHIVRLTALYFGAGMSSHVENVEKPDGEFNRYYNDSARRWETGDSRVLEPLRAALRKRRLKKLKLFDGLSVASLEAVIELLEAYANEIVNVNAMYQLLRGLQVGFRAPTEDDEQAVLDQFVPVMNQFVRRIMHLDARLYVLILDLEDEVWNEYGRGKELNWWNVHDVLFPPMRIPRKSKGVSWMKTEKA